MLTVIKLIVIAALITFLVIRFRSRTEGATADDRSVGSTSATIRTKSSGLSLRRGKSEAAPVRTARVRPRLAVSLPEGIEDEMDPVPDPLYGEHAEEHEDVHATVGEESMEEAVDQPTQVMDALVTTSGWPQAGELDGPYHAVDEFTADSYDQADREIALHGADASEWNTAAAKVPDAPASAKFDAENLTAAAGWATVDANEVGLDDAVSESTVSETPPAAIDDWQHDEDFDPASGWSDEANDDAPSTWTVGATEPAAEPATDEWASDDATAVEPADQAPAEDHSWQTAETEPEAEPVAEATPSWDVSDWAAPDVSDAAADEPDPNAWEVPAAAQLDELPAEDAWVAPLVAHDEVATESVDEVVAEPVAEAPVFADPMPTAEIAMPPVDGADIPEVHFTSATGDDLAWDTTENEVLPLGEMAPHSDAEPRTPIPVSADPTAPVIMYLQAGDEEMKVVIERDHTGNPIAWVLSGSAKVEAAGSAVRVRIPSPEEMAADNLAAAETSEQLGLPAGDEPTDAVSPFDGVTDLIAPDEEPEPAPVKKPRAPRAKPATTRSRTTTARAKTTGTAATPAKTTRTRTTKATTDAAKPTRSSTTRATTSRAKATPAKATPAKTTAAKTTAAKKTTATKSKAKAADLGPLNIAELVQAEANRRIAEVLAEHGSVKANGDFTGLVDRLEHVADVPAKGRRKTKA